MSRKETSSDGTRAFHGLNAIFAIIVCCVAFVDEHAAIRLTALVGVVWLTALLAIPRLTSVQLFARWRYLIDAVNKNRKYLGLWAAVWLTAHGGLAVWVYFESPAGLFAEVDRRPIIVLEIASLGILLLLALLSNKWSIQHIRHWKHIQLAVWAIPAMAVASSFVAAQDFLGQPPLLFIATILLVLCLVVGMATLFSKQKQPADWVRLGFLVAGTAAALAVLLL
jgi:DMSO/TMAO reductase YedYZ heme-binding membrane subunit